MTEKSILQGPVSHLYGVGKVKAGHYQKLQIETLDELLHHFPRAYENRGDIKVLAETCQDTKSAVVLTVATEPKVTRLRRGMSFLKFRAYDDSDSCDITYFNQDFLKGVFKQGETYRFWGKVEKKGKHFAMSSPVYELYGEGMHLSSLVAVYRLTDGLSQKQVSQNIATALELTEGEIEDFCPGSVRESLGLCTESYALRQIHFPTDYESLKRAKRRLSFDELFLFALGIRFIKSKPVMGTAPRCLTDGYSELTKELPYHLTHAQERVIREVLEDMKKDVPMSRMIVGDVGCGKTICAAAALVSAVKSGYQAALMVPTEILARQHEKDLQPLLGKMGISVGVLLGSLTASQKQKVKNALISTDKENRLDVVIGTQALLTDNVSFANPALVITDEQHRFGVAQRAVLSQKNHNAHVLVMSATPIPRTLALALYGDLQISRIDEMPPGRQKVSTFLVDESYRERLNGFIRAQVKSGGQVYVVCPAVEEKETPEDEVDLYDIGRAEEEKPPLKAATVYAEQLQKELPDVRVAFVHGKMKGTEKDAVMSRFANGEIDVLVSTTVIEVGVNVPNACLMIVENAERFGLSQLHQLRGRVGRGTRKSWCILVSDAHSQTSKERLGTMTTTYDGYAIAEKDLAQRGPGDFLAVGQSNAIRQSGGGDLHFKIADLSGDLDILTEAFTTAEDILKQDETLASHPTLRDLCRRFAEQSMGYMN